MVKSHELEVILPLYNGVKYLREQVASHMDRHLTTAFDSKRRRLDRRNERANQRIEG